ncbi:hypothetical protein [Methylobacterium persicinum]|jgi:hypothetical protein|uniref:SlyX protein n=1 Tax=Methylobacterium persicinum TaxID=374426 RepID=A0ABU0HTM7_9HYPH|nr:hypothetical protein [Methylobacterium persicinum]MDQ0445198.1 hypothetical protein [Methylobacterium persicinum]GJE37827.1 hypothetical protein KHHGKMAE_1889 [Methylobacterium persicinum]
MREEQADQLIKAVQMVAVMLEEQNGMLGDIHRRLAEIAEAAEKPAPQGAKSKRPKQA